MARISRKKVLEKVKAANRAAAPDYGAALAQAATELNPDLPVLLCTGYSEKMTEERATQLGFDGYLVKPLGMYTLAEKIRKLFRARPVTLAGGMGR